MNLKESLNTILKYIMISLILSPFIQGLASYFFPVKEGIISTLFNELTLTFLSLILFTLLLRYAREKNIQLKEMFSIPKMHANEFLAYVSADMSFAMITWTLLIVLCLIFIYFNPDFATEILSVEVPEPQSAIAQLIIASTLVPLVEETICRGIIFTSFKPYGTKLAIYLSAFLFALLHDTFISFPTAFVLAFVSTQLFLLSNSLLPSILLHSIHNFVVLSITMIHSEKLLALLFILTLLAVVSYTVYSYKKGIYHSFKKNENIPIGKENMKIIFSIPHILLFILLFLF